MKHLLEELSDAPMLRKLKPDLSNENKDEYFHELPEKVDEKLSLSEELNEAPSLQELQTAYKLRPDTPQGYFEKKAEEIADLISDEEVIGAESLLMSLKKEENIDVPEGYFEQFPDKLNLTEEPRVISFKRRPLRWMSAVAAAVVLLVATFWWISQSTSSSSDLADISQDDLIALLEFEGYDSYDLVEILGEDVIPDTENLLNDELSEEEQLEEVLLDEIDFSDLELDEYIEIE
ncbi:MAG: hypothetical protein AAGC85_03210 [Bacteroidota bacterium]